MTATISHFGNRNKLDRKASAAELRISTLQHRDCHYGVNQGRILDKKPTIVPGRKQCRRQIAASRKELGKIADEQEGRDAIFPRINGEEAEEIYERHRNIDRLDAPTWESVRKALRTTLEHYGDAKVISIAESYIKRGRLTLSKDFAGREHEMSADYRGYHQIFAAHNTQRLTVDPNTSARLRKEITDVIEEYKKNRNRENDR